MMFEQGFLYSTTTPKIGGKIAEPRNTTEPVKLMASLLCDGGTDSPHKARGLFEQRIHPYQKSFSRGIPNDRLHPAYLTIL
jgi:hypothetical protein